MKKALLIIVFLLVGCSFQENPTIVNEADCNYYFYETLSDKEQKIYRQLYKGLACFEESIYISSLDGDAIKKASYAIYYDHPELFYYRGGYQLNSLFLGSKLTPVYHHTKDEAIAKQQQIEQITTSFDFIEFESDYEALKYLFDYIVLNVDYDSGAEDNQNLYSGLVQNKSVCAGYAREMQYLCQQLGIECLYVSGQTDEGENHAWNIVLCDGHYYHVDPTHGDRQLKESYVVPDGLKIKYIYLCLDDELIYRNRKEDMDFSLPSCDNNDLNFYQMNGLYFDSYNLDEIKGSIRESLKQKQNYWQGQFSNEEDFNKAKEEIKNNIYLNEVLNNTSLDQVTTKYVYDEDFYIIYCWY